MKPWLRNTLAVLAGVLLGGILNSAIVSIGPMVIPLPEGASVDSMEAIRESIHLFSPVNFLTPFLAHALGTLLGAFVAAKLAATHARRLALGVGVFFLVGGISAAAMIGGPAWFIVADLVLAYLPMGYLGAVLASRD